MKKKMAALVFPGFQTLDFFGPIELLAGFRDEIELVTVSQSAEPVESRHGQRICVDRVLSDSRAYDLLFIPGGDTALEAAKDAALMQWVRDTAETAERVLAVCTGTILVGMTGVLDGKRATTNKLDFTSTVHLAPKVHWVKQARWVAWIWRLLWQLICSERTAPETWQKAANTSGMTTQTGTHSRNWPDWSERWA